MPLPWFRMDSNFASHDKVLALLADPSPRRWQAAVSWVASIGYSQGNGTNGLVPFLALPFCHGTKATAELLVKYNLWQPDPLGWQLPNFADRNPTEEVTAAKRMAQRAGAAKGNCIRHHGRECRCWEDRWGAGTG